MGKPVISNTNTSWGAEANKLRELSGGIVNPILHGKKVLWMGTSIPFQCTYPANSCGEHGALLTNVSLSSSMIRKQKEDGSFTGLDWSHYTLSLSQTSAEKEYIIANWATIKSTLTGGVPATLSGDQETAIRNSSYEIKLVPNLDAELFVIDHGVNDRYAGETEENFKTIPATYNNRDYFIGAMNYIIEVILTANPRAKIAIFGFYENTSIPRISEAQQIVANYWQIPIGKTWEFTRWSNVVINGSSMLLNWLPDGLHPAGDLTGEADLLLDRFAANFLRQIV